MPKHCNLAKHRVFTKDRNAYICITQQFSVMLIDNKYTKSFPILVSSRDVVSVKDTISSITRIEAPSQAMMFEHMGRIEQSIEVLEQILLDFPFETESYNGLGYVLADNNIRLDDAVLLIERALAMAPDSVHIQDSYGWVNFRLGNLALAKSYLEVAWDKEPLAEVAAHLADVYYELGDTDKAFEYLQRGYELDSTDRALLATMKRLGYTPEDQGEQQEATDELQSEEVN